MPTAPGPSPGCVVCLPGALPVLDAEGSAGAGGLSIPRLRLALCRVLPEATGPRSAVACLWDASGSWRTPSRSQCLCRGGGGSGVCRALGQTDDSLSSLCDRRWWPRQSSQHAHGHGPCRWLGTRGGPQGPRSATASQQAACTRCPWPRPCPRGGRQAQGQPAPCHLCLRLPVASPAATSHPSCPAPGCLPLEARDLWGPAQPAWPPHRERAEGLAWTRATPAQRAPRTLPPAAPGVQPSFNKVSSRNPERRAHDGYWGARPRPGGGVVPVGYGNRHTGLGEGLALRSGWGSRRNCPRHTVPAGVSRWPGRPARPAGHWSGAMGGDSCLALGHSDSRGP